jgi:hypothetical protein
VSDGRFLLVLDLGGHIMRLSSAGPVEVDGELYEEGLGLGAVGYGSESLTIDVFAEPPRGWAVWVASRGPIEDRPASIYWHRDGETLDEARLVLRGLLVDAQYGGLGEQMDARVVLDTLRTTQLVPPPTAAIGPPQWDFAAEAALGKIPPLVFGYPGSYEASGLRPVVPAYCTSTVGGVLAVAYGEISATVIDVYRIAGGDGSYAEWTGAGIYTDTAPLTGHTISYVDADGGSGGTTAPAGFIVDDGEYYTSHDIQDAGDDMGGIAGPDGEALTGAADIILWLLERYSDIDIDRSRWDREAQWLNSYQLSGWIEEPTDCWDWITRSVLPHLPVLPRQGPNGLWLQPRRYSATTGDVRLDLSADRGDIIRTSRVGRRDEVFNRFSIEYGWGAGRFHSRRGLQGVSGQLAPGIAGYDAKVFGRLDLQLSEQRHGTRVADMVTVPVTWDASTATRILSDHADRYGWPKRSVQYVGGLDLDSVEPGTYVSITDSEIGVYGHIALVEEVTVSIDEVVLDLTLLDHPLLEWAEPAVAAAVEVTPLTVSGLRSWWDAYDSATYDGSDYLLAIGDKGPDGLTMAPAKASGMLGSTFQVGTDAAAFLPGNATITVPDSHPEVTVAYSVADFTLFAVIPIEYAMPTGRCYFSWNVSTGSGFYGLLLQASGTTGALDIADGSGVKTTIQIGLASTNGTAASAIVCVRRAGGVLTVDAWYDRKLGSGVQKPTQVSIADPLQSPIVAILACLGGRSSISQAWNGDVKAKVHTAWWYDRELTDDEVLSLAQWAGNRVDISGIS